MMAVKKRVQKSSPKKTTDSFDRVLAQTIKSRRLMLGVTQQELAEAIGVTFQQVQKYENATNRVSASRLRYIAKALDVTPGFFYQDNEVHLPEKGAIDLVCAYNAIKESSLRKQLLLFAKSLAKN